jgi:uncharacterized glyoxalase superfamily protein PhnB
VVADQDWQPAVLVVKRAVADDVSDPARTMSHDDTTLYFGCPDVDAAYRHLRSHGLDVDVPKVSPYGMKQLYVKDPDGYNLCFQRATRP